tara:strand:+ start:18192 stop:18341 length:150 start_codon:yes stop_codon:yes gene_type:complete
VKWLKEKINKKNFGRRKSMPYGKGTYGNKVGRPKKKKKVMSKKSKKKKK